MARRIRALHDYAPTGEGQIALKASVTYELLDDSGPWWTVRSDMGQQGIVPSNYVEMVAGAPVPLPQAPPGYAPQAAANTGYPPQQMGMPQQQMGMPQQQMPQQMQQTTVIQMGAPAAAPFVNPGGAQCHTGWFCGIAAMLAACNAASATNDSQYQSALASARCCNIAGSSVGVITLIIIIIIVVMAGAAVATVGAACAGTWGCTFSDDDNDLWGGAASSSSSTFNSCIINGVSKPMSFCDDD